LKKILLLLLFISTLYSDAKIYMGVGAGIHHEHLSTNGDDTLSPMLNIKAGYGDRKAYAIEFSLDYVDTNAGTFLTDGGPRYGFNVSLLKAFDFNVFFIPLIRVGFGSGSVSSTSKTDQTSLAYGSFNLGVGTFIPINEYFDLEVSYDYRNTTYEKTVSTANVEKAHTNVAYFGCNFRY